MLLAQGTQQKLTGEVEAVASWSFLSTAAFLIAKLLASLSHCGRFYSKGVNISGISWEWFTF